MRAKTTQRLQMPHVLLICGRKYDRIVCVEVDFMSENKDLVKGRSYYVVKGNELITKSRYGLSMEKSKILLYLISRIKPTDEASTIYTININDFCRVCGYDTNNGYYFTNIKRDIKGLADESAWIEISNGREELFRWIDTAIIEKGSGKIQITFHKTVAPYLFELRERYTQYSLLNILNFHSKYSIRIYELCSAVKYQEFYSMKIEDLKRSINAEKYEKYTHFKMRVLEPAIEDINLYSDLNVRYEVKKTGKSFTDICFFIESKPLQSYAQTLRDDELLLNGQINMFDIME